MFSSRTFFVDYIFTQARGYPNNMDNEVTINFLSDERGKNDKGQVRLFKTYASDKCWRITTRTRKEKCGWFSLVSLTRPLFCDSISFPDGRDPEPVAVIRGGRVRKNRGWYRFDPGSAGPCMARARQLAKKERKKERSHRLAFDLAFGY